MYHRSVEQNLRVVYNPVLKFYHKEDAATDCVFRSARKKHLFVLKNIVKSKRALLEFMRQKEAARD